MGKNKKEEIKYEIITEKEAIEFKKIFSDEIKYEIKKLPMHKEKAEYLLKHANFIIDYIIENDIHPLLACFILNTLLVEICIKISVTKEVYLHVAKVIWDQSVECKD